MPVRGSPLVKTLVRRLRRFGSTLRFWKPGGYRARRYWEARHGRFGFDMRGVGDLRRSDGENRAEYAAAESAFASLCEREGIALDRGRVLEVGCGTGFYTRLCVEAGARDYTGIDIAETLFPELRRRYPGAVFERCDITERAPRGPFDLILMIDVEQHIVHEERFERAMQQLHRCLAPGGALVMTSWLAPERRRRTLYEVERPKSAYAGWRMGEPRRFRDKWIFVLRQGAPK